MTNCLKAIIFSLVAHSFVAFGLAFWIGHASTIELPLLDLSAVEISFSEEERESPAVPPPEPDTPPPPPEPDTPPPPAEPDTPPPPLEPDTPPPPLEPDTPPPPPEPDTTPPPPEPDTTPPPPEPDTPPPPPEPEPEPTPPEPEPEPPQPPSPIQPRDAPISREPTSSPAPKQARVDAPPKPLKSIKPDYPKGARQRGEEGDVALELAINARGGVDSVTVVESSGFPDLDAAALRAATKARFVPAKAGKNAVSSVARITISFRLTSR